MPNTSNNNDANKALAEFNEFKNNVLKLRKALDTEHQMNKIYSKLLEDLVKQTDVTKAQYELISEALNKIQPMYAQMSEELA